MSDKMSSSRCLIIMVLTLISLAAANIASAGIWTQKADMPTARELCGASVVNDKIYVIGGWDAWNDPTPLVNVEVYDPVTDTWEKKDDMPAGKTCLTTAVVNGRIYAIGGAPASGDSGSGRCFTTMYEYDPNPLVVDFNGDGIVDSVDVCMMLDCWNTNEALYDIAPLPFGDGTVDVQDLILLSEHLMMEVDDPTLVAHWALDEIEGAVACDSANGNDGAVLGDPTWQPTDGQIAGALELDGVDDYVSTLPALNPAEGAFSVFAWIKGGAPGQVILSQQSGVDWLMTDPIDGSLKSDLKEPATTGRGASPAGPPLISLTVVTDSYWHHIGFVWDGSSRILYVDDVEVARDTAIDLESTSGGLYMGVGSGLEPDSFFSGLIDDVRIYSRAVKP